MVTCQSLLALMGDPWVQVEVFLSSAWVDPSTGSVWPKKSLVPGMSRPWPGSLVQSWWGRGPLKKRSQESEYLCSLFWVFCSLLVKKIF